MDAADLQADADARSSTPRRRRGLIAFACFAVGLVVGLHLPAVPATLWLGAAAGLGAVALLARGWPCRAALVIAVALLGAGWIALRVHEPGADTLLATVNAADEQERQVAPVLIRGTVLDRPRAVLSGHASHHVPAATRFSLRVSQVQTDTGPRAVTGTCTVTVSGTVNPAVGDRLELRGYFVPVGPPLNPGERDRRLRAVQDGYAGRLSVESSELIQPWPAAAGVLDSAESLLHAMLANLRGSAAGILESAIAGDTESEPSPRLGPPLLGALLLGQNDPALRPLTSAMSRLGQVHVLSISGFHLAVMAAMALFLIRLTGDRGSVEPLLVAGLVVLYLLIVPAEAPVLRSGLMVLGLLLAESTGRRYDRLNLLGWIAIALLLWRPLDLWSAGFQLSFGVTAALLWLGTPLHARWFPPPIVGRASELEAARDPGLRPMWHTLRGWCTGLLTTSILCWAVATPAIMHHVGIISPLAALTSVVLVPLFTAALWTGFAVLLIGAVWPAAAQWAGVVLGWLGDASASITLWLDGLSFMAVTTPRVSALWAFAATAVILVWMRWGRLSDVRLWSASAMVLAWLVLTLSTGGRLPTSVAARLDALAVGNGTAILIRSAEHTVLWGGCSGSPGTISRAVPTAARALDCWRVRTVVIPGGAPENYGELPRIARTLGIRDALVAEGLLLRAAEEPTSSAATLLDHLRAAGVTIRPIRGGESLRFGTATLTLHDALADDGAGASVPGSLAGELAVQPADGPRARILLLGHLRRPELEQTIRRESFGQAAAVELPEGASSQRASTWLLETGAEVVWTSEAPRLAGATQLDAGATRLSTASHGAIRIDLDAQGRLTCRTMLDAQR